MHTDADACGDYASKRHNLVAQLRANAQLSGIELSEEVLDVIGRIPRERFMPYGMRSQAYDDRAQPIGLGQTLSQPAIVAWMTTLLDLRGTESILEIGTGSGYQTLVLSMLVPGGRVVSIERLDKHARHARRRLRAVGRDNILIVTGDGSLGYALEAPYDRILVTAGAPRAPRALLDQLALGGRLVAPIGSRMLQELVTVDATSNNGLRFVKHGRCSFVPLVGAQGWSEA